MSGFPGRQRPLRSRKTRRCGHARNMRPHLSGCRGSAAVGIARASRLSGAGNPEIGQGARRSIVVLGHGRRQLLWIEVTRHPTAEWLARQITEAFTWTSAPAYLVRDNDGAYGHVFTSRVRAMGIRDRPISPGSPWQNGYAERLIGTLRRECLDRMLIFGEAHLRRVLASYAAYYNQARTHLKSETIGCDASATKSFYWLLYRVPARCTTRLARGKRSKQRAPSQANRGSKKQGRSEVPLHVSAPNRKHSHG
jgi:transposase InsO family protein